MPNYRYKAVREDGRWTKGSIEAPSAAQAIEELKERQLWIAELIDMHKSILHRDLGEWLGGLAKIKPQEFTVFCRQLATMYKAGVSLVDAMAILVEQTDGKHFRKVLSTVLEEMKNGAQFSDAVSSHPTVFSEVFVNMIKAGEASGNLDDMLERAAIFYEKEFYTREKVKSAMIYPIIMSVVMTIVVVFMMIFVIPKYVENFQSMGVELPLPTKIVIAVSDFIMSFWFLFVPLIFVPYLISKLSEKSRKARYLIDTVKLQIPIFGLLRQKQAVARFARTFSSLYAAAIPVMQALTIVSRVVESEPIRQLIMSSRDGVRSGQSMTLPFERSRWFPPMVVQMIAIGERSGSLDTMLEKIADFYEQDVDAMADRLKSLLEPLMILAISGVVGAIVMAILMPTFKLMESLA